jgi:DNA ligase (NAD+)
MTNNNTIKANPRIKELEALITYHQNAYYNNEAEITDYEFDELWDELKLIDPENPILHRVGEDNFGFKKINHVMPMGSQHKASSPEEFQKWFNRMESIKKGENFIVQHKLDGLSIELQYKNGKFVCAVTRGNGLIGDDVTANVFKTGCIVHSLPQKKGSPQGFTGAIRGEVLLSHKMKDNFFPTKENCRNAANGCLKRKDGEGCEYLHIIVYDAFSNDPDYDWSSEGEKVYWLKSTGYDVVITEVFNRCQDIINYRNEVNVTRNGYDYDIDGIVVKTDSYSIEDLGRDRPTKQIAFKFVLDEVQSVLLDVEWSVSGKFRTPVAICEPVRINGTTVKRANLANYGLIKSLNLKIGDTVILVKRGEIIPKIIGVVKTETNHINKPIIPPKTCEVCGTSLETEGVHIVCPNPTCPEQIAHRIQKWINTQKIKFIGDSTIHKLVEKHLISSIADLYKPEFLEILSRDDIVGNKMARKIYGNINNNRVVSLPNFIGGFDIDHVGTRIIESLMKFGFTTFEKILNATMGDLCICVGIHTTLAGHIKSGINAVIEDMYEVLQQGVRIEDEIKEGLFLGKSACFTGSFSLYKRSELEKMFIKEGGKVGSGVSSNTDFLVSNDPGSTSSKTLSAKRNKIPIINEKEFIATITNYRNKHA